MPNIECEVHGKGELILFLHGWGQKKEMMLPLIEELKYKYKCVIIDLPGFGNSTFNNEKNLEEYVKNIRFFLEEKDLLPKYIIGHSFGGKVALNYYLRYKDLHSIIFIASPLLKPKRTLKYYYNVYKYKLKKRFHIKQKSFGSEDYKNCSLIMKSFFVNVVNAHFDKVILEVDIPTLLIWGDKDDKVPLRKAKQLHKKISKSELIVQKGGHFAYLENIEYTRLIIQKFLRRNSGD